MQHVARVALVNPAKKKRKTKKRKATRSAPKRRAAPKRKTKTTKRRRTYTVAKKRKVYRRKPRKQLTARRAQRKATRRRSRQASPRRRRGAVVVRVNPVEKDVIQTLKTGGIMAAGGLAAYVLVDYLKKSVDFIAENEWAAPAVMIAGGMGTGMVLTGKNRPLATKLGLGMVMTGIITLVGPYLADKLPGLPVPAGEALGPPMPTAGYYSPAQDGELGAYQRIAGYYGDEIPGSVGQLDPMASDLNAYAGDTLGKGYH